MLSEPASLDEQTMTKRTERVLHILRYHTKKKPLCELIITRTYSKSSWCGSNWQREMTTTPSVFGDTFIHYTAEFARQGLSPMLSAFTISTVHASCLFIDAGKTRDKKHLGNSVYRNEGERIFGYCSVRCIRWPTDKHRLEKPTSNTCKRTPKTSEIVVFVVL